MMPIPQGDGPGTLGGSRMDVVTEVKSRLARYPELSWTATENSVEAGPQSSSEFCIGLSSDCNEYTIHLDGRQQDFEPPEDAPN